MMQLFNANNRTDTGWKQLEQHGIAIPNKWVETDSNNEDNGFALFVGQDVKPDGNCLLRCLAQSGLVPYDYQEIRQALYQTSQIHRKFGKLAYERSFDERPYDEYCHESLRTDGEWTGDFEMLLFVKTFGINIVSFSTSPFGLLCFNANDYVQDAMKLPSLLQDDENKKHTTIYLLHHAHGNPTSSTCNGDHFALLLRANDNIHPITREKMDPSKAFYPPLEQLRPLPHDTNKFVGNGTSRNDPLEEVDNDDSNDDQSWGDMESSSDDEPVVVLKRKAPDEYNDNEMTSRNHVPASKRMVQRPPQVTFRSPFFHEPRYLWRECRDPWFQRSILHDESQRRVIPYRYSVFDDFFF